MDEFETPQTHRQKLAQLLEHGPVTLRELASEIKLKLKETAEELEHLSRSLAPRKILIEPASCIKCGYTFRERKRWTTPSRCPKCRSEKISDPLFSLPEST